MATHIITVVCGGKWLVNDSCPTFVGDTTSKVFMIDETITLHGLTGKVHNRFNIDSALELKFNHLHPFKFLRAPLNVECDADLKEFLRLCELQDVKFAVELCFSIKSNSEQGED